jgi:hypothetical protein
MRALLEEILGAVAVPKIVKLPWICWGNPGTNGILVNQDFNRPEVTREIACASIRFRQL